MQVNTNICDILGSSLPGGSRRYTSMPTFDHSPQVLDQLEVGLRVLRESGVVAVPTDTLYGLAASAVDEEAVRKVFALKGRPGGMALPLLLADPEDFGRWALDVSDLAWAAVRRFMPGPLTIVLRKAPAIPDVLTGGLSTVALRIPDHPIPRALVRELGVPITGTSANRTGRPGLTRADAVREEFGADIAYVIDGGETPGGLASTVIDLSGDAPRLLRHGALPARDIEEALGPLVAAPVAHGR